MNQTEQRALDILAGLARNPAVPFHEWGVAEHILGVLVTLDGVEYGRDDFGNIIAHYIAPSIAALPESEREPPIAFVAHMDHPGYEIFSSDAVSSGGRDYIAPGAWWRACGVDDEADACVRADAGRRAGACRDTAPGC